MKIEKHSKESIKIKELEDIIFIKNKEMRDIKNKYADKFKNIKDICVANEYGGCNDKSTKLRKINEIASDSFYELMKELLIMKDDKCLVIKKEELDCPEKTYLAQHK